MNSCYMELRMDDIELDFDNPRIAKYIEQYGKEQLTSEAISLALGGGTDDKNGTSYSSLKESIKSNGGIIHPIIVNKTTAAKFVVIEGNTRVQIYKEFILNKVPGEWNIIRAIVYENLEEREIHAIRLQSHLVGPRDWDAYSKAKYLNYLSNNQKLPMSQIVSFCGGKQSGIVRFISAYNDMENYYRSNLHDDSEFDQREFSKFVELQNGSIKEALLVNKYDINDFSKWIINRNIDTAMNVRKLPEILKNKEATKIFLKSNISNSWKTLAVEEAETTSLKTVSYDILAAELTKRLERFELKEVECLKNDPRSDKKKENLIDAYNWLKWLMEYIGEE